MRVPSISQSVVSCCIQIHVVDLTGVDLVEFDEGDRSVRIDNQKTKEISKSHTGVQSRQESKGSVSLSARSKPAEQRAKEKAANDRRNARNRQALKDNPGSPLHRGFSAEKRLSLFDVLGLGENEPVVCDFLRNLEDIVV